MSRLVLLAAKIDLFPERRDGTNAQLVFQEVESEPRSRNWKTKSGEKTVKAIQEGKNPDCRHTAGCLHIDGLRCTSMAAGLGPGSVVGRRDCSRRDLVKGEIPGCLDVE